VIQGQAPEGAATAMQSRKSKKQQKLNIHEK